MVSLMYNQFHAEKDTKDTKGDSSRHRKKKPNTGKRTLSGGRQRLGLHVVNGTHQLYRLVPIQLFPRIPHFEKPL